VIIIRCSKCGRVLFSLSYAKEIREYRCGEKKKRRREVRYNRVIYVPKEVARAAKLDAARFMYDDFLALLRAGRCPYCGNPLKVRKVRVGDREIDLSEFEKRFMGLPVLFLVGSLRLFSECL